VAASPSHTFGQIIGDLLEEAVKQPLKAVAAEYGLYLDFKHPRPTRGNKAKVSWIDIRGNSHDLDFVLEQGGTEAVVGRPKAFIEIAWRRYTKHSKNKAQEIEGAIGHLKLKYHDCHPFLGAILAGEFTAPSLEQLKSHGFTLLYFSYKSVIQAFEAVGIDATFNEDTPDEVVQAKVDQYRQLTSSQRETIIQKLRSLQQADLDDFIFTEDHSQQNR